LLWGQADIVDNQQADIGGRWTAVCIGGFNPVEMAVIEPTLHYFHCGFSTLLGTYRNPLAAMLQLYYLR
jgi:hypothetical protein